MNRILLVICVCALCAAPAFAQPNAPAVTVNDRGQKIAPAKASCTCGASCACPVGKCPACPAAKALHVSPDGTVNELCADGIYRPVSGAAKRVPVAIAPVSFAPVCVGPACAGSR